MLNKGTHIQVTKLGYTHHGIFIGNESVIHYSGFHQIGKKGKISITSLDKFSDGSKIEEYKAKSFLKRNQLTVAEIIERAKSRIGEDTYNLAFNNCEHFANWCTHNDDYSFQTAGTVENCMRKGIYGLAGGLTIFDVIRPFKGLFK
jgi:5-keto 4-deoxyuronate isomerase